MHKDEATVELNRLILPPDYSHSIPNGNSQVQVDLEEQCVGSQRISSREASVPRGEGNSGMGARVPM